MGEGLFILVSIFVYMLDILSNKKLEVLGRNGSKISLAPLLSPALQLGRAWGPAWGPPASAPGAEALTGPTQPELHASQQ